MRPMSAMGRTADGDGVEQPGYSFLRREFTLPTLRLLSSEHDLNDRSPGGNSHFRSRIIKSVTKH